MEQREEFRLPVAYVRRKFLPLLSMLPISVLVMPLVGLPFSVGNVLSHFALISVILGLSYVAVLRYAWVSLSPAGLGGHGGTGRRITIQWNEPTSAKAGSRSAMKGLLVAESAREGNPLHQVFIPEPILALPSFRAAVQRLTPSTHVLRAHV